MDETLDVLAIGRLSLEYASALDRRDLALLLGAFDGEDARLVASETFAGAQGLAVLLDRLATRWPTTFHFVGNTRVDVDGDGAIGEVYCSARHRDDEQVLTMHIRYDDDYRRRGGRWKIVTRRVHILWAERSEPVQW
jgi:hypothetical protein